VAYPTSQGDATRRQPVAQAAPQIAQIRQPRPRVDPCGGGHIVGEPPLGSGGFRRRLENAPLWIEAFRRPPLHPSFARPAADKPQISHFSSSTNSRRVAGEPSIRSCCWGHPTRFRRISVATLLLTGGRHLRDIGGDISRFPSRKPKGFPYRSGSCGRAKPGQGGSLVVPTLVGRAALGYSDSPARERERQAAQAGHRSSCATSGRIVWSRSAWVSGPTCL
jgi:hypothetical protein